MGPSGEERDGRLKSAPPKELPSRAVDWAYDSLSWLVVFFVMVELGKYEKRTHPWLSYQSVWGL